MKGYNQSEGVDYEKTFYPIAKIVIIGIIITNDVNQNWNLHQFDINNAFYMVILRRMYTWY